MTSPRALLTAWDIQAKKQLGQNFLKDPNVARSIVGHAAIDAADVVLEIGPGLGAITVPAAKAARKLIAIDKDGRIIGLLRTELLAAGIDNVEIREADILKTNLTAVHADYGRKMVVMGNLPYNISSQVVVQLIHARSRVDRAVLMLQKEMAQRICADPGSKAYGRLSVMLGYCSQTRVLMQVNAAQFFPAPKVDSTVIGIQFMDPPPFLADDEAFLFRVIKTAFGKRRKTLRNALSQSDLDLTPARCERLLAGADIDPMLRAERLSVRNFVDLANIIYRYREDKKAKN
jgi:16S rRNA (adenine1518-N6/adenine1519-N6)-dimethyltransferase